MRLAIKVAVKRLDPVTSVRTSDFDYTREQAEKILEQVELLVSGVILVDDQNNIYKLGIVNIVEDN